MRNVDQSNTSNLILYVHIALYLKIYFFINFFANNLGRKIFCRTIKNVLKIPWPKNFTNQNIKTPNFEIYQFYFKYQKFNALIDISTKFLNLKIFCGKFIEPQI